jgi:hypothetical protein
MERLCTKPKHVLSQMLRLMILRRHYSTDCSDYQAMRKQFPDVFFSLDLQYGNTRCIVPVYDVLVNMKINCEDQDYCTLLAKELLGRRLTIEAKRALACAICFFGSRSFLQDMSVKLQSRAGLIKCTQVNCAVKKLLSAGLPHQLFTASFRFGRIAGIRAAGIGSASICPPRQASESRASALRASRFVLLFCFVLFVLFCFIDC